MTKKCFDNMHLTPAQYGFMGLARSLSHKTGELTFDGRKFGQMFGGNAADGHSGKNPMYRLARELAATGWLEVVTASVKGTAGKYSETVYHVLTHDEWAIKHPGCCNREVVVDTGVTVGRSVEVGPEPEEPATPEDAHGDCKSMPESVTESQIRQSRMDSVEAIVNGTREPGDSPAALLEKYFGILTMGGKIALWKALNATEQKSLEGTDIENEMLAFA